MHLIRLIFAFLGSVVCLSGISGCSFYSSADPNRGSQALLFPELADDTWPARASGDLLAALDEVTPEHVTINIPYRVNAANDEGPDEYRLRAAIRSHGVYGRGLVREFGTLTPEDGAGSIPDTLVVPAALLEGLQFVSFPSSAGPTGEGLQRLREEQPDRYRRFLLRRLGLRSASGGTWTLASRGTRMRLYEPAGKFAGKVSRGLVIHLSSLAGLGYELPIVAELTSRGWAVLIINASTARRDEPPVFIDPSGDFGPAAGRLARMIDNRVAEIAYAAEAGVEFLADHYPRVQTGNLVVIGYSAGALTAPAVAELLHDHVSAVVLVGGGANLLDISQRSSLTNGGIDIIWKNDQKSDDSLRRLNEAYLQRTKLDPYALAPRLQNKPVLMLHGAFDDIIPADTGAVLRARLGRCDCFTFTLGHRGVFFLLPAQGNRIARWLDERVGIDGSSQ